MCVQAMSSCLVVKGLHMISCLDIRGVSQAALFGFMQFCKSRPYQLLKQESVAVMVYWLISKY